MGELITRWEDLRAMIHDNLTRDGEIGMEKT